MARSSPLPLPLLIEVTGTARDRALARAPQAEWGLAHQGARVLLSGTQESGWLARGTGRHLVALGLPLGRPDLGALARTAKALGRTPLLYKCDGRTARAARSAGWSVARLGVEAVLDLPGWSLDRPACRQLRRKLRAAAALRIEVGDALPLGRMENVARGWAQRHGGERGFSMGRYDPALLRRQKVLLAWSGGNLVGFASFHATRKEWTLDLMRQVEGAPDGAMHRLIHEAVTLARAAGAERLSLAAITDLSAAQPWMRRLGPKPCGLAQFKGSFGPRLTPRYAAAPGPTSLALGLVAVGRAILRPGPIGADEGARLAPVATEPRARGAQFGFETAALPCDARPTTTRPAALSPGRPALF